MPIAMAPIKELINMQLNSRDNELFMGFGFNNKLCKASSKFKLFVV